MKILITGSDGMLANSVIQQLRNQHDLILLSREGRSHKDLPVVSWDITEDLKNCDAPDIKSGFDAIVHCAAYTKVDLCESEKELAFQVNRDGTESVLEIAKSNTALFIYISSDYVFSGVNNRPYKETDKPDPISVYGESKREGEKIALNYPRSIILRGSWLYGGGPQYQNFVNTIIRLAEKADKPLRVVDDQRGKPTNTDTLALVIEKLISKNQENAFSEPEIFHVADTKDCTWFEFAKEILRLSGKELEVTPVTTEEFPRPAKRPAYSVMNTQKIESFLELSLPTWKTSLKDYLERHYSPLERKD